MTTQWQDEAKACQDRDVSRTDFLYLWVDGIDLKVRLKQDRLCLRVMIVFLTVGDGAGVLEGMAEGLPEAREQRCWFHKQANVLAALLEVGASGAWAMMTVIIEISARGENSVIVGVRRMGNK